MVKIKNLIRQFCPPIIYRTLGAVKNRNNKNFSLSFKGNYKSYADAFSQSQGYEDTKIVHYSAAEVSKYEKMRRDSNWIDSREQQLMMALALIQQQGNFLNSINILDFGGGTGRHYFLIKHFFPDGFVKNWTIAETEAMVKAGKELTAAHEKINYITNINNSENSFEVIHASGVIHLLNDPNEFYTLFLNLKPKFIIFNRMPFIEGTVDRLTLQTVTRAKMSVSFPAWFLSEKSWLEKFKKNFDIIARWRVPEDNCCLDSKSIISQGLLLKAKGF